MSKVKVFLTGGDGIGWAVDEDLRLTGEALGTTVDLTDLDACDVVHSVWWEGLTLLPQEKLRGKRIVCAVPGEPFRYFQVPAHQQAMSMVGCWMTHTSQAYKEMKGLGIETTVIPYLIDVNTFKPLPEHDPELAALKSRLGLPSDSYLIGSFQRDTEGADLKSPKMVKGPDVFVEVLRILQRRGLRFHVVLAGPRRHWMIRTLTDLGLPFTYVGQVVETDDLETNSLPRATLNLLYDLLDLYVVASRSEGGPHAILEAAAARCKLISSPVGMAEDVLEPLCIFRCAPDAADLIEQDMTSNTLGNTVEAHFARVHRNHCPESVTTLFERFYQQVESVPIYGAGQPPTAESINSEKMQNNTMRNRASQPDTSRLTVGLWHTFYKPPYGGGNQFMMALRKGLLGLGVQVVENELREGIDAYVLNSIHFDVDRFLDFSTRHRLNVVHRIDGPIHLIRGFDREKDELCYDLNARFASATVIQSAWTFQRIVDMGYRPVRPIIVHNAVDRDTFHATGRIPFDPDRKIRLISSSWSNNPRKGGSVYKWIEDHLDWDRFEYTFVGNASEQFSRIAHVPAVPSEELAALLREHDIYITASRNDPCSNALIEALACGLPALYFNDGGHPELVGQGGLPFREESEILPQLERLVAHYETFQRLITVNRLEDVAGKYLALIREIVQ